MRRQRGMSLVEMMVAIGLAGLVVAGVLQMQRTFASMSVRQNEINDLQQSLRMTMQILERAIHAARTGMVNGKMLAGAGTYYGFRFANRNTFPQGAYDNVAGDNDADPDWFTVIASEDSGAYLASADAANVATIRGTLSSWQVHDLFLVLNATATPATSCLREVTALAPPLVTHASAGTNYAGINPSSDSCIGNAAPAPVRRFVNQADYRILLPAPGSSDAPRLAVRYAPIGSTADSGWTLFADGIEDMQLALVMNDGTVCNDRDDPALCDPSLAAAVRVTLVGRTSLPMAGAPPSTTGGYEDRAVVSVTDGYIRRALTTELVLRN